MPDAQGLKLVNLITTAIELVANLLLNLVLLPSYGALSRNRNFNLLHAGCVCGTSAHSQGASSP
jgi:hypothetical protein